MGGPSAQSTKGGAVHARVTHLEGSPDRTDQGIKMIEEQIIPEAKKLPGFKGGYWCMDRETGKGMSITLWESLEALRATEQTAGQLRESARQEMDAPEMQVSVYEVIGQA
jgi:heme-degrading monooxygenase HmoA